MVTGIHEKMSYQDYTKVPGVNASALKIGYMHSMAHVRAYIDGEFERKSAAMDFGTALHALALEGREEFRRRPDEYKSSKGEMKPWNANSTTCKAWLAGSDKYVVTAETEKALRAIAERLKPVLDFDCDNRCEVSVFSEREGLPIKCRVDMLPNKDAAPVVDLKTCSDANPEKFMREALRLGYHLQAAWTLDILRAVGIKREEFRIVAIESKLPHGVCVLRFIDQDVSLLRVGRIRYREQFGKLKQAIETGKWPSYGMVHAEDYAPMWMKRELELT